MTNYSLLRKIANGKVDYDLIQVHMSVEVMVGRKRHKLDFDGAPIGEVFEAINDLKLWTREYFWNWTEQGREERLILVATPKGMTDFMDLARFIEWVRVFTEADDDCDEYDSEA